MFSRKGEYFCSYVGGMCIRILRGLGVLSGGLFFWWLMFVVHSCLGGRVALGQVYLWPLLVTRYELQPKTAPKLIDVATEVPLVLRVIRALPQKEI